MKSFAAAALVAAVSAVDQSTFAFMQYVSEHSKNYATLEEFNMRQALFAERDAIFNEWNSSNQTSTMGHNFMSDMTETEKAAFRGLAVDTEYHEPTHFAASNDVYDMQFDWCTSTNSKGVSKCTPIKNQGACGGCWAFSATETVESAIAIFNDKTPVEYSPQQLISCSSAYGNHGCNGGWYYYAWNYMKYNAQETEADYPYSSGSMNFGITGSCTAQANLGVVMTDSPTDYVRVGTTVADIKSAINRQPSSIAVDASQNVFQYYNGGVVTNASACGTSLDHAIVVVGYGQDTSTGVDYFVVRNSWGESWGLGGFIYLEQTNYPGMCGMNEKVYYPNAKYA
jgi:C1A family cysteine protease